MTPGIRLAKASDDQKRVQTPQEADQERRRFFCDGTADDGIAGSCRRRFKKRFINRLGRKSKMTQDDVLKMFKERGALLQGHFKLTSGLH